MAWRRGVALLAIASCGGGGGGGAGMTSGAGGSGGGGGTGASSAAWGGPTKTVPAAPNLEAPCDWHGVGHASDLEFSPDGALLVAAGGGYLKAFDAATGGHVFASPWHPATLFAAAFSPDGRWVATSAPTGGTSYFGGAAAVWRTTAPTQGRMLLLATNVNAVGFSSDSAMLAVSILASVPRIAIFELAGLSMVASVNQADLGAASGLTISANGRQLVYQGSTTLTAGGGVPWFGALIPRNASNGIDPPVPNWSDYSAGSDISAEIGGRQTPVISTDYHNPSFGGGPQIASPDGVDFTAVALSHGGFLLAAGEDSGHVDLWQLPRTFPGTPPTPTLVRSFTNQLGKVPALAFSPDDSLLATASDDGTLYVRRVSDGSEVWHAEGPPPALNGVSILAASESNNTVLAFGPKGYALDLTSDVIRGALDPGPSMGGPDTSCVGSRDTMAMICPGPQLVYRDLAGGQVLTGASAGSGSFTLRGGFALAPDHSRVIESTDNQMNLPASHDASLWSWPLPSGSPGQRFAQPDRLIKRLVYSGDGGTLAGVNTAINDSPIRAWDARSGAQLGQWGLGVSLDATTFFTEVAISDGGDLVAAVDNDNPDVALVRPRAGTVQRFAPTTDDGNSGFRGVAVSPDGSRVAAISGYRAGAPEGVVTHSITVFTSDGAPVSRVAGYLHLNSFPAAFLNSKTLLRGEHDGTVSVWCLP